MFTIFDLQVALILSNKFPLSWPFHSAEDVQNMFLDDGLLPSSWSIGYSVQEKKGQNRFSRWPPWLKSWIWTLFTPILPTKFQVKLGFGSGEDIQNRFQNGGPLGFRSELFKLFFIYKSPPILPARFWVSWHFGSGDKVQNILSKWRLWRYYCIFDRNDFSVIFFFNYKSPWYFLPIFENLKIDFENGRRGVHLDLLLERFQLLLINKSP